VLIAVIYSNSFTVPLLFDDITSITNKAYIYTSDLEALYNRFGLRVVAYFTFKVNYQLHELNVWGYHLVNVGIHILASFAVYWFAFLAFKTSLLITSTHTLDVKKVHFFALIAAVIFAVHPLQSQAVSYIVQRTAALASLFYIAAMASFLSARLAQEIKPKIVYVILTLIFCILAFYTKQNTFTLPIAFIALELIFVYQIKQKSYSQLIKPSIALLILASLAICTIWFYKPEFFSLLERFSRETTDFTRLQYFETQLSVLALYIKLFFVPIGQQVEYIYPIEDGNLLNSFGYIIAYLGLFIFSLTQIKKAPLIAFSLIFYFVAHLIESALIPISDLVFEHRTYLPNLALCMLVALSFLYLFDANKNAAIVGFCLIVLTLSFLTYQRNNEWRNPELLYKAELAINFDKPRMHHMLGEYYRDTGEHEKSVTSFKNAYDLVGNQSELDNQGFAYKFAYFNNYIASLRRTQQLDKAIEVILETLPIIKENKYRAPIYSNLGFIYLDKNQYDKCEEPLFMAKALAPKMVEPLIGLGICFNMNGDKWVAQQMFYKALELEPESKRIMALGRKLGL